VRLFVIVTCICLGLVAAATADARTLELAVQDDPVLLQRDYGDTALALDRAVAMGASRVRVNLRWVDAMPTRDTLELGRLERLYTDAHALGLRIQVTLAGPAPAWATGDGKVGVVRPDAAAFGRFAGAVAGHFAGRIDRYSIWNEPNWHRLLAPVSRAPSLYRALYRSGYAAIKSADPGAAVLLGELMPGASSTRSTPALKFLRGVFPRGAARLKADGVALHPYNFARRPRDARSKNPDVVEMGSLSRLTRALDALRRTGALTTPAGGPMPVYLTEFGYFTSGPVARSAATHAKWMGEAWEIARRNPRVRQLLQYQLLDPWPASVTWRSAVMDRDGTPRPVYRTLARLASAR
jgi:hypothetical protein